MRTRILPAIGALLLLVAQARGSGQAPAAPQQPTFKAVTTFVEVDAIVKDSKGTFVPDLTAADFEVREDGVLQHVEQLYLVAGPAVKTAVAVPDTSPAVPAPSASPAPAAPPIQRTFVFVFDQEHIEPGEFDRAKKAALQFMTSNFREGDIGGVVNGGTMINNRLTNVRTELETGLAGLKPLDQVAVLRRTMLQWPRLLNSYEVYQVVEEHDRETVARVLARACADDPDTCKGGRDPGAEIRAKATDLLAQMRASGQRTLRTIGTLCDGLARLPGRKTIVFLSDGFFAEDATGDVRAVVDRAARASVRLYSLDTRGLNRGSASSEILTAGMHAAVNPAGELAAFDTDADAPNSFAVDTGGLAIRNENDFAKALTEIANDTSSYYILGYRTTNTTFDGKFRQINVRVKREGLSVRARKGYVATATATPPPASVTAAAAAAAAPPAAPPVASAAGGAPATPPAVAAETPPVTPGAATDVIRLQPDVRDRLAALGKIAPQPPRAGAPPESVLAQARAGWDAYQKGDLKAARTALAAAAAHPAAPAWVHYTLGWTEFAESDYAVAGAEWERVRSAVPEFEPVYFDLADSYLQQHEFGKALEALRAAEKRWPNDVDVYNAIGVVQVGRGALSDAIKTFEQGVSVNANDATACYNLARTSEVRLIQSQRLANTAAYVVVTASQDKNVAIEYYRRTIAIGKGFVEEAKAGLRRLGVQ